MGRANSIRQLTYAALVLTVGLGADAAGHLLSAIKAVENWAGDLRIATYAPPEPQHPGIVIAAITEETLELFPYRSPVDRGFLAALVKLVAERGARAVLIDILFDQGSESEKDIAFHQALAESPIPVVISYGGADSGLTERQLAFQDAFVAPAWRAWANTVEDSVDGTVRSIYPGRAGSDGVFVPGVAGRMVERLGVTPPTSVTPLAYRGQPDAATPPFPTYPAHLLPMLPAEWLAGRIVFVGADLSLQDRHRTPFAVIGDGLAGHLPGVTIHAHGVAQLLEGRAPPHASRPLGLAVSVGLALLGLVIGSSALSLPLRLGANLGAMGGLWVGGFVLFAEGGPLIPLVAPSLALVTAAWTSDVLVQGRERARRRFIQNAFNKYLSPDLLTELIENPGKLSLAAERRTVSILFTDVAGFTALAESLDAERLSRLINEYRQTACAVVFRHNGTVMQFTGDGVYCVFNAPKDQPDHARRALACALELDRVCQAFALEQQRHGTAFGHTRIGVHCGPAAVGNFGSADRFEFGALGDTTNTASRIEGLNKYFGTRIAVSAVIAEACPDQVFRPLGAFVFKGKTEPLDIFEPLTHSEGAPLGGDGEDAQRAAYAHAWRLMTAGDSSAALAAFQALTDRCPDDGAAAFHARRLAGGATDGIVRMQEK